MKKRLFYFLFLLSFLFVSKVFAIEHISQYTVDLEVQESGDLNVQETIRYDFDTLQRHGIYRNIPTQYVRNGNKTFLDISHIEVFDQAGKSYPFVTSHENNQLVIKIGDADTLITGVHDYVLKYDVKKPVVFQDTFDRLSWNAIGTEWNVPIDAVDIHIQEPKSFENKVLKVNCYRGVYGVAQSCGFGSVEKTGATFKTSNLGQNKGLTIDIDLKKGTIFPPSAWEIFLEQVKKWWPVLIPFLTFVVLFRVWYKKGRDPRGAGTIVTQFDAPEGLTPAEVGTLVDQGADDKDVFAEIIYLATKGYLKIFKEEKKGILGTEDYTLTQLKDEQSLENIFDKQLMQGLFASGLGSNSELRKTVKMSDLKNKFYTSLSEIKKTLYSTMTAEGYFKENPWRTKIKYIIPGAVILLFSFYIVKLLEMKAGEPLWVLRWSVFSSAFLFFIFAPFMPARTAKGVAAKEHILGFKNYLTVAEKDRIDFHNAPEKNPATFEKFLPYAMALGVEKVWAKQFADLNLRPSWYGSSSGSTFNAIAFTSGMSHFSSVAKSNMASSPSSSGGGGSSGGGFGGGGGGSW